MSDDQTNDPFEMPIDGILDLHLFQPKELDDVVDAYLEACIERGISQVRIIHGKGIGLQRERVHALLKLHPAVHRYYLDSGASSWGATLVDLCVPQSDRRK